MKTKINKLDDIEKRNPFTVPDNYFANFNEEIMNRLPEKEVVHPQKVTMWTKAKPWVYMAAMFMGLFFTIRVITNNTNNQQSISVQQNAVSIPSAQFTDEYWSTVQITEEEFYQYLEDQLVEQGYYDYMYKQVSLN